MTHWGCQIPRNSSTAQSCEIIEIRARSGLTGIDLREVWEHRELLSVFVWRDLKVRYKQTILGVFWALLQPLFAAAVFTLLFGRIAGISSDGVPYSLFSYTGLVLWTFFAQGVTLSSNSLVSSAHVITKIYFPRVFLPSSSIIAGIVDLAIAGSLILAFAALIQYPLSFHPAVLLMSSGLAVVVAIGTGLWLSALNVLYRDVRFVVPFLIQLWLFLSPVIYPVSEISPRFERIGLPGWVFGLNPMTGAIEGFRWAILGGGTDPSQYLIVGWVVGLILLATGLLFFSRTEVRFADVV